MKRNPGAARHRLYLAAVGALLLLTVSCQHQPQRISHFRAPGKLQLWYWHHSYLVSDEAVRSSEALIDRAARSGYTGVAFWENSFGYLSDSFWSPANTTRLRTVLQYAADRGLQVMVPGAPYGWSNIALVENGNLAEAQRVIGSRFTVDPSGRQLDFVNSLAPLENAGFEEGKSTWFGSGDQAIGVSSDVSHSGREAAVDAPGNARFRQKISLTPWRQYHLRLWFKTKGFRGPAVVEVVDWWHRKRANFYAEIPAGGTQDWKQLDFTFNSGDVGWAYLYFGVWGRSSGVLWFDDVELEETAPLYVARRPGTPLRLYRPDQPEATYREGTDYDTICDPALSPPKASFRDNYHTPPTITLPAGTSLQPGQTVAIDYYAVFPTAKDNQVGMCLTESGVFRWVEKNARSLKDVMPKNGTVLLSYDEMRQMNSCASCRAKRMTAGELLAWNVQRTVGIFRSILPSTRLYIWNDMFDPYHNAKDHYYSVEGDVAGSWKGLPSGVTVLNWNHPQLRKSLEWFAGMDDRQPTPHAQIIAGYYDSGQAKSAENDLRTAFGVPGVEGIMYVSWRDDYTQLESFADSARKAWSPYVASVVPTDPGKHPPF